MSHNPSIADTTLAGTRTPSPSGEKVLEDNTLQWKLSQIPEARLSIHDIEKTAEQLGQGTLQTSQEVRSIHGVKWILVCATLYISAFTYGLDTTIAADVQGAVVTTFGNVEQLTWMGSGFSLGAAATILPIGALYGKFNLKWLYILSVIIFEGGSALCGGAPNMDALIVGRVIAGIGGSGVYLGVLNFIGMTTTERERGIYIGLTGVTWGLGSILGPVIGGAFADSPATWRWAFYINLVIAAITAPVYLLYIPNLGPQPNVSLRTKLASIDWIGFVLSAGFWVTFVLVVTFGGGAWPWNDPRTIAVWVVFGVLLVAFAIQQHFAIFTTKESRMFPVHLLKSRTQLLLYFGTAAATTSLFIPVYYIPIYFQFVQGDSALMAAVRLLPFILVAVSVNMFIGGMMPKIGYYMPVYAISGSFVIIAGSLMYTVTAESPLANIYGYSVLLAIGAGMCLQTGYALATVTVPAHDMSSALSLQNVAQIGSGVIALVISGQVFQDGAYKNLSAVLSGEGFSDAEIHAAIAGTQSVVFQTIKPYLRQPAIDAITSAISKVYVLCIVAGAVALVSSIFMKRERLFAPMTGGA